MVIARAYINVYLYLATIPPYSQYERDPIVPKPNSQLTYNRLY